MSYCILKKEFSEIFTIWIFMSGNFFSPKFLKISKKQNFSNILKIEKNFYFCAQISAK